MLLRDLDARHVGLGDFKADEFPFDPGRPEDLQAGANFRLETRLGDLDLIAMKRAAGRPRDLDDLRLLGVD